MFLQWLFNVSINRLWKWIFSWGTLEYGGASTHTPCIQCWDQYVRREQTWKIIMKNVISVMLGPDNPKIQYLDSMYYSKKKNVQLLASQSASVSLVSSTHFISIEKTFLKNKLSCSRSGFYAALCINWFLRHCSPPFFSWLVFQSDICDLLWKRYFHLHFYSYSDMFRLSEHVTSEPEEMSFRSRALQNDGRADFDV